MRVGDGQFIGELAVDAISSLGEQYADDAEVLAASVMIVVEDRAGVHVEVMSGERVKP
jgi:hypothetical protein